MGEEKKDIVRSTWMAEESEWFSRNEKVLEKQHPGKWIAISGPGLIAVGDSPAEVEQAATAQGVTEPLVVALRQADYQDVVVIRRGA